MKFLPVLALLAAAAAQESTTGEIFLAETKEKDNSNPPAEGDGS